MTSLSATDDLPPPQGERHVLAAEIELRLEVSHGSLSLILQKGSCELWGVELALNKIYTLTGGAKLALFTWHGCVIDVDCENLEISYTSDETNANVAYVNTHAQLETLRDEALASQTEGPRVLIAGPPESGKSSLAHILIAYGTFLCSCHFCWVVHTLILGCWLATKLGRTPLWVDLDPADNALSVPGTLAVAPVTASSITVEPGLPPTTPLVMWYGSTSLDNTDLFKAQVSAMSNKMDQRMQGDSDSARASGIIVNTNGWIQDVRTVHTILGGTKWDAALDSRVAVC
jgi:polyribonucleotide 5'-hydroxyl-kinase